MTDLTREESGIEWGTLALIGACYALWALGVGVLSALWLPLGIAVTVFALALHSSLTHEVLHGHPFRSKALNEALMFPAITLAFPYGRFRDTHLAHHQDENLTDPYDDPESNFADPAVWERLSGGMQALLRFNNTLFGRMLVGPALGVVSFYADDLRAIVAGDRAILRDWLLHLAGVVLTFWLLARFGAMPLWAYLLCAYLAMSVLKIRTFLEHRAHERARGRTVIIEDRGLLAFLFLYNNLHVVHHTHPKVPWHRLPALYQSRPEYYLGKNEGYRYASYGEVFRRYFAKAKDPVPHPIWPVERK